MKAIFEIEFNVDFLIDRESLDSEYGGSYFNCLKNLLEENAITIYDLTSEDIKLLEVRND